MAPLAPYVAGKTGTTEDENDTWFVGFTNDITVAVWVGYDNAGDAHRTLGDGATGASVAAPIFQSIVEAAWSNGMSKTVLAPPSAQARTALSCDAAEADSGKSRRRAATDECLRLDPNGHPMDARYRLVSRDSAAPRRNPADDGSAPGSGGPWGQWHEPGGYAAYGSAGRSGGWFGGWRADDQPGAQRRGFWNW